MGINLAAYLQAQHAMAELKGAVLRLLLTAGESGLKNSQIGRSLGIYAGHVGHEGHIPRTILAMLEAEGVVRQDKQTKSWNAMEVDFKNPAAELD